MSQRERDRTASHAIGQYWSDVDDECPETRGLSDAEKQRRYGTQFGWGGPEAQLNRERFYAWDPSHEWLYVWTEHDGWQPI